jgi:hypothetical protein
MPVNDPMTTVGADDDIIAGDLPDAGNLSVLKTDAYRAGVGQPLLSGGAVANATAYCAGMRGGETRVANDLQFEVASGSPNGDPLNVFMTSRFNTSVMLLNCALFGGAIPPIGAASAATPAATPAVTPAPDVTTTTPAPDVTTTTPAPDVTTTAPAPGMTTTTP